MNAYDYIALAILVGMVIVGLVAMSAEDDDDSNFPFT